MSPGGNFAMVLRNSLRSRRAGVLTALGLAAGNAVHATYSILGLAVLVAQSVTAFTALKWAGAAYLVYVGIEALRARPRDLEAPPGAAAAMSDAASFRSGLLTDLLNP